MYTTQVNGVIQLVWYILEQLFTSVLASRLSKYLPVFTSTSVNIIVNYLERQMVGYTEIPEVKYIAIRCPGMKVMSVGT